MAAGNGGNSGSALPNTEKIFSEEEYHQKLMTQTYSAILVKDPKLKERFFGSPLLGYLIKTSGQSQNNINNFNN